MNILMVLSDNKYPPDGRVEREARDLLRAGHEVYLMARRGLDQPARETCEGVQVIRAWLPFQGYKPAADLIYQVFQKYFIFFLIVPVCRKHHIEALHVHDLPYAWATTLAGKLLKIPVIFDMHENYLEMMKNGIEARGYRLTKPLFLLQMALMRREEKTACRRAHKVIVVAEEHIGRIKSLGVKSEDIVAVTNTEDVDHFRGLPLDQNLMEKYQSDFIILYFGGLSGHRGIETAIAALPQVRRAIPSAKLLLVGSGYYEETLRQITADTGVTEHVIFTGFQPFESMPSYIHLCRVGLIPHISTPHIETTMPNKIFQFMVLGKPVVVSSTRPMMRVVQDAHCGLIFQERDAASLAEALIKLKDADLRRQLGENGKRAVQDRYNWRQTVQALLEIYRNLKNNMREKTI